MRRALLDLLLLGLALPALAAAGPERVGFARDVVPILRTNCAVCHLTGQEPGGMKLYPSAAYRSIVKMPSQGSRLLRVTPGDPQASYFLHKIQGTHLDVGGTGAQMPFGQPPLAEAEQDVIRRWITQGALDN